MSSRRHIPWLLGPVLSDICWLQTSNEEDEIEHAAILTPGTWERVQNLLTHRAAWARGKSRNKHLALLSGLLYCEACFYGPSAHQST